MNKTKIDWCDSTWNPVTGCFHDCEYCYARKMANRFGLPYAPSLGDPGMKGAAKWDSDEGMDTMLELEKPYVKDGRRQPYPMGFYPTFHRYKLDEPRRWTTPRTIFVCSMADLFGEWVPDEWITDVFRAVQAAPWHRYLFLTKNPARYARLSYDCFAGEAEIWLGTSITASNDTKKLDELMESWRTGVNWFVSVEPILEDLDNYLVTALSYVPQWVIVGAESGNREGKVTPRREWVERIAQECGENGTPLFMKESLRGIMGEDFRQEWPWEVERA